MRFVLCLLLLLFLLLAAAPLSAGPWGVSVNAAVAAPVFISSPAAPAQSWLTDYTAAREEAAATGKPLFIFCTITGCRPCLDMEHVFNGNPAALAGCVRLRLKNEHVWTPALGVKLFPSMLLYGPDGGYLWSGVGSVSEITFRECIARAVPAPAAAIERVAAVDDDAEALNLARTGVDHGKLGGGVQGYKHSSGRQLSRHEAFELVEKGLPDDGKKFRLTVIGSADQRAAVLKDWLAAGDLAEVRDRFAVWTVRPDHPLVSRFGFATAGAPTIYCQAPPDAKNGQTSGEVIHHQDDYKGPGDFQAIRKAVADYDAKKDPDRRKPDPAPPAPPVPAPTPAPTNPFVPYAPYALLASVLAGAYLLIRRAP